LQDNEHGFDGLKKENHQVSDEYIRPQQLPPGQYKYEQVFSSPVEDILRLFFPQNVSTKTSYYEALLMGHYFHILS
jgi:hypothetical protein